MQRTFCDKCGYPIKEHGSQHKEMVVYRWRRTNREYLESRDICSKCYKELDKFLANKGKYASESSSPSHYQGYGTARIRRQGG